MNYLILTIFMVLVGYIFWKKRKLDYFTVLSLSSIVYYFPVVLGRIRPSEYSEETVGIVPTVYFCIIAFSIVLFMFIYINDKCCFSINSRKLFSGQERPKEMYEDGLTNLTILLLEMIALGMLLYTFVRYGGFSDGFNKMQLLSRANRITEYMKFISLFTFVYAFINKGKLIWVIRLVSLILIGYTFLLGHRSFIVLGLIGILLFRFGNGSEIKLSVFVRKHIVAVSFIFVGALFFLFIKGVFVALVTGQYDIVQARLSNPDYYLNTFLNSESNSITLNLQRVCENNMTYSMIDYLFGLVELIPILGNIISNKVGHISFEAELNNRFNVRKSQGIGLGSTFIGEGYAVDGILAIVILSFLMFLFILWLQNKLYCTNSGLSATFFSTVLPYLTFYLHRNSTIYLLIMIRAYIYILIVAILIRCFTRSFMYRICDRKVSYT